MGWMGDAHSRAYNQLPDRFFDAPFRPRLVVCADAVEARAREAQARFGFERWTTDWRDVVNDPAVEVVDVTAPNGMHLEINRAVAAAGKHLACEKPVGRNPTETIASWEAVRDRDIRTWVGFNYRWAPMVQYARKLVEDGELGPITHYHGRFLNGYASDPRGVLTWRFEADQGLGTLGDLGVHVIDMAHFLAGPIARVTANRETFIKERPIADPAAGTRYDAPEGDLPMGQVTNEDYVSALVRFGSGAQGILEACRVINGAKCDMSFEIHGTRGAIRWSMESMNELHVQRRDRDHPDREGFTEILSSPVHPFHGRFNPAPGTGLGYDDTKTIEAHEFLSSVVSGVQGSPGLREAADAARVELAIMRSWDSERWETVAGD
jgi:predicted dehydrogenase